MNPIEHIKHNIVNKYNSYIDFAHEYIATFKPTKYYLVGSAIGLGINVFIHTCITTTILMMLMFIIYFCLIYYVAHVEGRYSDAYRIDRLNQRGNADFANSLEQ